MKNVKSIRQKPELKEAAWRETSGILWLAILSGGRTSASEVTARAPSDLQ